MNTPRTRLGENLSPWTDDPVFGWADNAERRHRAARIESIASRKCVARTVRKSGGTMIASVSTPAELIQTTSANHSHRAAVSAVGVRETMVRHGVDKLTGATTRGPGDIGATREEAA